MAQNTQYRRYAPRRGKKTQKGGLPLIVWLVVIAILVGALVLFVVNCQGRTTKNVMKIAYPQKYSEYVNKAAADYNLPPALIYAVIRTESGFDPDAESSVGARGLMQLMPSSFEWLLQQEDLCSSCRPRLSGCCRSAARRINTPPTLSLTLR